MLNLLLISGSILDLSLISAVGEDIEKLSSYRVLAVFLYVKVFEDQLKNISFCKVPFKLWYLSLILGVNNLIVIFLTNQCLR